MVATAPWVSIHGRTATLRNAISHLVSSYFVLFKYPWIRKLYRELAVKTQSIRMSYCEWTSCFLLTLLFISANGICDPQCNSKECLFDGRDCEPSFKQCNPVDNNFCERHYNDGSCDQGCNNAECDWDGMDCETNPPLLISGVMSIVVRNMDVQSLLNNKAAFLRYLGHQLRTTLRIKQSPLGNLMVYPWDPSVDAISYLTNGSDPNQMFRTGSVGVLVYLEIDNRKCGGFLNDTNCFQIALEAAEFLAASAQRHTLDSDFDIIQVRGLSNDLPHKN